MCFPFEKSHPTSITSNQSHGKSWDAAHYQNEWIKYYSGEKEPYHRCAAAPDKTPNLSGLTHEGLFLLTESLWAGKPSSTVQESHWEHLFQGPCVRGRESMAEAPYLSLETTLSLLLTVHRTKQGACPNLTAREAGPCGYACRICLLLTASAMWHECAILLLGSWSWGEPPVDNHRSGNSQQGNDWIGFFLRKVMQVVVQRMNCSG